MVHRGQKTAESAEVRGKRRAGADEVVAKRAEAEQARAETGAADKAAKEAAHHASGRAAAAPDHGAVRR